MLNWLVGYALSENYLYTVEAFKQYLQSLEWRQRNARKWYVGILNYPGLIPLVVESLRQEETGGNRSMQDIGRQILVVEDSPGLILWIKPTRTVYPVLVIVKNSPFTSSELDLVKRGLLKMMPKSFIMPGGYVQPPYEELLSSRWRR